MPAAVSTTNGEFKGHRRFSSVPAAIDIPMQEAGDDTAEEEDAFVEVALNQLPDDPTELCTLLDNESCSRDFWILISMAYSREGNTDLAIEILNRGLQSKAIEGGQEQKKLPFWGALSWLYLQKTRESIRKPQVPDPSIKYKEHYLDMTTNVLNHANRIDATWAPNQLARGVYSLIKGNLATSPMERKFLFDNAYKTFEDIYRSSRSKNMFALMGKARVMLRRKKYKQALEMYQECLAKRPDMDPDPRIGIGLCLWNLDHKDHAKLAWERSLALKPDSKVANLLLGLYWLNKSNQYAQGSPEFVEAYSKAITQYTQKAFKMDKDFPLSCTTFGTYFFAKRAIKNVDVLARKALEHSDVPEIISDAHYLLARRYHSTKEYDKAQMHYSKSDTARTEKEQGAVDSHSTGYLPARVGMGQLQLLSSDYSTAKLTFERILQHYPRCNEAIMILGTIYANEVFAASSQTGVVDIKPEVVSSQKKAIQYLEMVRSAWKDPSKQMTPDFGLLLNLARLYESEAPEKALNCMQELEKYTRDNLQTQENGNGFLDPRILNNVAVFHHKLKQYGEARSFYEQALDALPTASEKQPSLDSDALATTLTYNLGRLEEDAGRTDEATKLYEGLLSRHAGYVDANARFLYLAIQNEKIDEIPKLASKLMQTDGANPEVRALVGWYMGKNRRKFPTNLAAIAEDEEHRHHKHSLQRYDKHDRYALTAMGNLYLVVAREMKRESELDREKRSRMYEKAIEFFDKALQLDGKNAYAAQGIAIALIEDKRNYSAALQILTKIKEIVKSAFIYVNLGHCLASLDQFTRAIENYELAIKLQGAKDHNTINCLARVWCLRGKKERTAETLKAASINSFKQALALSKQALELCPAQTVYQFNVAFVQFQLAQTMLNLNQHQRTLEDMEAAAKGLDEAINTFTVVARGKHPPYPPKDIEQRAIMGRNTVSKQLERHIVQQREYEETNHAKLEEARRRREEERKKKQEEEEAKKRQEEEARRILEEKRKKDAEEVKSWRQRQEQIQEQEKKKETMFSDSEGEGAGGEKKKRKTKSSGGSKPKKKKRGDYDSQSEDGEDRKGSDSEGEPRASSKRKKLTSRSSKKFKSKDFIDSEDEDMDVEVPAIAARKIRNDDDDENSGSDADLFGDEEVADSKPAEGKSNGADEPDPMDISD